MQILIVYFSRTGNTRALAENIHDLSGGELEEIREETSRAGLSGYMASGKDSLLNKSVNITSPSHDPADYDLVVVGTPVWAFTMAPAVRVYLKNHAGITGKKVAFFCTERLAGHNRTFRDMEKTCGQSPEATLTVKERDLKDDRAVNLIRQFTDNFMSAYA